jgi:molybdopterin converting factor small subunit
LRITVDLSHGTGMHEDKQLAVELPDGSTTKDLIAKVADKLPQVDLRYVLILVNDELIYVDRVLADGDVVKVFPPTMGG